jgi:hypothetical protein
MTDREAQAQRLDEMAAQENGLAKAQTLAAEADRLRRLERDRRLLGVFSVPILRN